MPLATRDTPTQDVHVGSNTASGCSAAFSAPINGEVRFVGQQIVHHNADSRTVDEASEARKILGVMDPREDRDSLADAKGRRVAGTWEWILKDDTFQAWCDGRVRSLSIYGGPGRGKTVLAIFLSQELEARASQLGLVEPLYFFCYGGDQEHNSACAVIRSLICQILKHRPGLFIHIKSEFNSKDHDKVPVRDQTGWLWGLLKDLLRSPGLGVVTCLLDGLDECDKTSRTWLFHRLPALVHDHSNFKLICLTRKPLQWEFEAGTHAHIPLEAQDGDHAGKTNDALIRGDLERFVDAELPNLPGVRDISQSEQERMRSLLVEKAEGTFLWIGYVLNGLKKADNAAELVRKMRTLPKGLSEVYSRMLRDIKPDYVKDCMRILRHVITAFDLLSLEQLANLLDIQSMEGLPASELVRDQVMKCGPLLRIDRAKRVRLVHQSARDYLLGRSKAKTPDPRPEGFQVDHADVHREMAWSCINIISQSPISQPAFDRSQWRSKQDEFIDAQPALMYAIRHWPDHVGKSSFHVETLLLHPSGFFQDRDSICGHWLAIFSISKPNFYFMPPLLLVSSLGLRNWVKAILDRRTALGCRIEKLVGKRISTRTFLRLRLSTRKAIRVRNPDDRYTALHTAAFTGQTDIARDLLKAGLDVNVRDKWDHTPLYFAKSEGHLELVKLLSERGGIDDSGKDKAHLAHELSF